MKNKNIDILKHIKTYCEDIEMSIERFGNDPYLYGEKVKAYLIRGAKGLPGYPKVPNEMIGWGALCLRNSLPG